MLRAILSLLSILYVSASADAQDVNLRFRNVAAEQQLEFEHSSPFTPERHLHLTMGSGLGWLDYDLDGRSDLYLVQGCSWNGSRLPQQNSPSDQLYRNLGNRFQNAKQAGIQNLAYGMGIAIGDYNNDGFSDVYVTNFGPNLLFCNNGDGTFSQTTTEKILNDPGYGASVTWIDMEPDGDLDLFVTNYLDIDDSDYVLCQASEGNKSVAIGCPPWRYPGAKDLYFENLGNGEFDNCTAKVGLDQAEPLAGLGVIAADLNDDGFTDLFVANDSNVNHLWQNTGAGTFIEMGLPSGTAINREGEREAGMGVAIADVDHTGTFDLFLTHYFQETNTLYKNLGGLFFLDVTDEFGMAGPSRPRLSFGTNLSDFTGDGFVDCFIANGHIHDLLPKINRDVPFEQAPQIFVNRQGRRFGSVGQSAGDYFQLPNVGRGSATADYNLDGRIDIAVQHLNGPVALLKNESNSTGNPISIQLIGRKQARDPIGAIVRTFSSQRELTFTYEGSSSYLSSNERRITILLGLGEKLDRIEVTWTGGKLESWDFSGTVPRLILLIEETGQSQ